MTLDPALALTTDSFSFSAALRCTTWKLFRAAEKSFIKRSFRSFCCLWRKQRKDHQDVFYMLFGHRNVKSFSNPDEEANMNPNHNLSITLQLGIPDFELLTSYDTIWLDFRLRTSKRKVGNLILTANKVVMYFLVYFFRFALFLHSMCQWCWAFGLL